MKDLSNKTWNCLITRITNYFAIGYALFHLYTAAVGSLPDIIQRAIHVSGIMFLFFMSSIEVDKRKLGKNSISLILAILSIISSVYIIMSFDRIMTPMFRVNTIDIFISFIVIVIVLEATRRLVGWFIPCLSLILIVYAYFGNWFPGIWQHKGVGLAYIAEVISFSTRGVFGAVTQISSSIIIVFVIFGSILFITGGGNTFMDLASWLTANSKGGAAKVAAVASGLFGMISGSAAANVATTGAFTIPLMKRLGYKSEFAAAVEASASSGGQIMPPIMGAGAFIMAEMLAVPYSTIMIAAIIPALIYYYGLLISIDFEAKRLNYVGIPRDQIPNIKETLRFSKIVYVFVPIIILLVFVFLGFSVGGSALRAIVALVVIYLISDVRDIKNRFLLILKGLEESSKDMIAVVALITSAQIVLSMIALTGVGVKFSNIIIALGETSILLAAGFAMIAVIILGMGLPTVGAYMLGAAVLAPAIIRLGVDPLSTHLFIFYYAIFSGITPPICGTVYVAAAIAQADWLKTAWKAIQLSVAAFAMPYVFVFSSSLLLVGTWGEILWATVTTFIGVTSVAAGATGYFLTHLNLLLRIIFLISGAMMISPVLTWKIFGCILFVICTVIHGLTKKRTENSKQVISDLK